MPACARQDHQNGRNKHRREHSGCNQSDAVLDVSRDWFGVERSKCWRHELALPVLLTPGESAKLLQGDSRDPSNVRGMEKGHHWAHKCHRSRWEQCRSKRSRCDIREKCHGRARRSTSFGRFIPKRLIPPKIDLHMQVIPSPNNCVCKSPAPAQNAQQENYKLIFQSVNLIIRTKQLTSTAHGAQWIS